MYAKFLLFQKKSFFSTNSDFFGFRAFFGFCDVDMCGVNMYDYMCQLLVRFDAFHVNDSQCRSAIQYLVRSRLAICDYR